jgi:hypothetical protein
VELTPHWGQLRWESDETFWWLGCWLNWAYTSSLRDGAASYITQPCNTCPFLPHVFINWLALKQWNVKNKIKVILFFNAYCTLKHTQQRSWHLIWTPRNFLHSLVSRLTCTPLSHLLSLAINKFSSPFSTNLLHFLLHFLTSFLTLINVGFIFDVSLSTNHGLFHSFYTCALLASMTSLFFAFDHSSACAHLLLSWEYLNTI